PVLVSDEMVRSMKPGAVIVDVAIDQGGNFETSDRIMTHENPVYEKHEVLHYTRSEEHTSELQSRFDLVCRLLLEKKNTSWRAAGSRYCASCCRALTSHVRTTILANTCNDLTEKGHIASCQAAARVRAYGMRDTAS